LPRCNRLAGKIWCDVLQTRWAIALHLARTWPLQTMHDVMTCCVIMQLRRSVMMTAINTDGTFRVSWLS
jgi:hypothetical protein